jgi:hypothetical protein
LTPHDTVDWHAPEAVFDVHDDYFEERSSEVPAAAPSPVGREEDDDNFKRRVREWMERDLKNKVIQWKRERRRNRHDNASTQQQQSPCGNSSAADSEFQEFVADLFPENVRRDTEGQIIWIDSRLTGMKAREEGGVRHTFGCVNSRSEVLELGPVPSPRIPKRAQWQQHIQQQHVHQQRGAAAAQWKKKKEERQTATSLVKQQQQQLYAGATTAVDGLATLGLSTFGLLSTGVQALRHVGTSSLGGWGVGTKQSTTTHPPAATVKKQQERIDDLF